MRSRVFLVALLILGLTLPGATWAAQTKLNATLVVSNMEIPSPVLTYGKNWTLSAILTDSSGNLITGLGNGTVKIAILNSSTRSNKYAIDLTGDGLLWNISDTDNDNCTNYTLHEDTNFNGRYYRKVYVNQNGTQKIYAWLMVNTSDYKINVTIPILVVKDFWMALQNPPDITSDLEFKWFDLGDTFELGDFKSGSVDLTVYNTAFTLPVNSIVSKILSDGSGMDFRYDAKGVVSMFADEFADLDDIAFGSDTAVRSAINQDAARVSAFLGESTDTSKNADNYLIHGVEQGLFGDTHYILFPHMAGNKFQETPFYDGSVDVTSYVKGIKYVDRWPGTWFDTQELVLDADIWSAKTLSDSSFTVFGKALTNGLKVADNTGIWSIAYFNVDITPGPDTDLERFDFEVLKRSDSSGKGNVDAIFGKGTGPGNDILGFDQTARNAFEDMILTGNTAEVLGE